MAERMVWFVTRAYPANHFEYDVVAAFTKEGEALKHMRRLEIVDKYSHYDVVDIPLLTKCPDQEKNKTL